MATHNSVAMSDSTLATSTQQIPRSDIITPEFIALLEHYGVSEAYLFGSVSRGQERPDSDVDIVVRFGHEHRLAEQLDLMVKLSRLVGREVDVLTNIDPIFEPYITPTFVPIPL